MVEVFSGCMVGISLFMESDHLDRLQKVYKGMRLWIGGGEIKLSYSIRALFPYGVQSLVWVRRPLIC